MCPDWCLYTYMHIYMCVSEFVSRCGLCEFQANDGLQKSDNRVNTHNTTTTDSAQDYCVRACGVLACLLAGWIL